MCMWMYPSILPVGDVFLLVDELVDDPAEGEQRPVDLSRLPRLPRHRARPPDVLRAGQVHQVQLALDVLLLNKMRSIQRSYGFLKSDFDYTVETGG